LGLLVAVERRYRIKPQSGLGHSFFLKKILQLRQGVGINFGLHGAELGTAHRAELSGFVDVGWKRFVVIFASPIGVKGQLKLTIPVEVIAGCGKLIVAIAGTWSVSGNVCRVCRNLISNKSIPHVLSIR
jgi:hypothetical protein